MTHLIALVFLLVTTLGQAAEDRAQLFTGLGSPAVVTRGSGVDLASKAVSLLGLKRWDNRKYVAIRRDHLDQPLLLSTLMVSALPDPSPEFLGNKLVRFVERGGKLVLLEDTTGHVVNSELPQGKLLASFAILSSTKSFVVFDFDAGMRALYLTENYTATDDGVGDLGIGADLALGIDNSYIEALQNTRTHAWIKHQVQLVGLGAREVGLRLTFQVNYYFRPYLANLDYRGRLTTHQHRIGYFEAPLQLEPATGRQIIHAMRWNPATLPVTFTVDPAFPHEYDAVLAASFGYWNRITQKLLGKDAFSFVRAEQGTDLLAPHLNVLHWASNDEAGAAFATFMADPVSGELLNARVFLPSVFTTGAREALRHLYRRLHHRETHHEQARHSKLALSGFETQHLCDYELGADADLAVLDLLSQEDDARESDERIAQAYLTSVLTHELGHVLGLRHNFAGSLASQLDYQGVKAGFFAMMEGKRPSNAPVTSSVMDYLDFREDVLAGEHILGNAATFEYDRVAITWGYQKEEVTPEQLSPPRFCTDGHVGSTIDCERSDGSPNVILHDLEAMWERLAMMPYRLAEDLLTLKETSMNSVQLQSIGREQVADNLAKSYTKTIGFRFFDHLLPERLYLAALEKGQTPELVDPQRWQRQSVDFVKRTIRSLGGYKKVFERLLPQDKRMKDFTFLPIPQLKDKYTRYLRSEAFQTALSQAERDHAKALGEVVFDDLNHKLAALLLAKLSTMTIAPIYPDEYLTEIYALVGKVLGAEAAEIYEKKLPKEGFTIQLHRPRYNLETRLAAIGLLSSETLVPKAFLSKDRKVAEAKDLVKELEPRLNDLAPHGKPVDDAFERSLGDNLRLYRHELVEILEALDELADEDEDDEDDDDASSDVEKKAKPKRR